MKYILMILMLSGCALACPDIQNSKDSLVIYQGLQIDAIRKNTECLYEAYKGLRSSCPTDSSQIFSQKWVDYIVSGERFSMKTKIFNVCKKTKYCHKFKQNVDMRQAIVDSIINEGRILEDYINNCYVDNDDTFDNLFCIDEFVNSELRDSVTNSFLRTCMRRKKTKACKVHHLEYIDSLKTNFVGLDDAVNAQSLPIRTYKMHCE